MNTKKLTISIIGTGAIGGYYGIILSQMGHDVHFLLNSDYNYVQEHGLTLKSAVHGQIKLPNVNAYNNASKMPISDLVIIALKTTHNTKVLPTVLPFVANQNSTVILIQNGLGMEEEVANMFPNLQFAGATALICSSKEKNGIIKHDAYGAIDFGSYNLKNLNILEQLSTELSAKNIRSTIQDLKLLRWKKLVWNMTFNGLSVAKNANTNILLTQYRELVDTIMQEVVTLANCNGVDIPISFAADMIPFTKKMGSYAPSMRQDYLNGKPLELDYLYQKPIEIADKLSVKIPAIKNLYQNLITINSFV